jgi:hypothetical protein
MKNRKYGILALATIFALLSSTVSAGLFDNILELDHMVLSITSGGKCGVTAAGGQVCILKEGDALADELLIVDPYIVEPGQKVKLTLQLTQLNAPSYVTRTPNIKMIIKSQGGQSVELIETKAPFTLQELQAKVDECRIELGTVICGEGYLTVDMSYVIPSNLKEGQYTIFIQVIDTVYKSALSAVDTGDFRVSRDEAIECDATCGTWQETGCIGKQLVSTRVCQTGETTASGTACDSDREYEYRDVDCCEIDECGSGVCRNYVCTDHQVDDIEDESPNTASKKVKACEGKGEKQRCEVEMKLTLAGVQSNFGSNYKFKDYTQNAAVTRFGGKSNIGLPFVVVGECLGSPLQCDPIGGSTRTTSTTVPSPPDAPPTTLPSGMTTTTVEGATSTTVDGVPTTTVKDTPSETQQQSILPLGQPVDDLLEYWWAVTIIIVIYILVALVAMYYVARYYG